MRVQAITNFRALQTSHSLQNNLTRARGYSFYENPYGFFVKQTPCMPKVTLR